MDLDPPSNETERNAMYSRLLDILEEMFVCKKKRSSKRIGLKKNKRPSKAQIQYDMRRIIGI